jgi:hypothetical protein
VALRPRVRNTGATPIDGLTAVISADDNILAGTNFGNCFYSYAISCTFSTSIPPGDTFQMSAPFVLRTPRDAVVGSRTSLNVQWLTAAEWEDQEDGSGPPEGRAGTGPDLELAEVTAAAAAGAPQADTDHDDNGTFTDVSVTGGRRTDVTAFATGVTDTLHEVQDLTVGLVNQGPGTLRHPLFFNNGGGVHVVMPAGVSVVRADQRCRMRPYAEPGVREFDCSAPRMVLRPGQRLGFAFAVRVNRVVATARGEVEVYLYDNGEQIDRDPRNNTVPIRVTAAGGGGGLPVTGADAMITAGAGVLLVLVGVVVLVGFRRAAPGG